MAPPYNKPFIRKIVRHYLRYDRDNPFIFFSAVMAFLGIAAGVMVMMIAIGVTNGIQKDFKERLFVMNYPLTVISYTDGVDASLIKKIQRSFPTLKLSPYYTTQAISKNEHGIQGSMIYGVNFEQEAAINTVFAKVNKETNSSSKYRVTGIQSYDKGIIYTTHKAFHSLLKREKEKFDGIHIYSEKPMEMISKISAILPEDAGIEGWWQQNGNFFTAMEMEKKVYFLVLLFIILIASLNIISSLLMTVMSRRSEIALMRTLGATQREIRTIFYRLGLIIGSTGIAIGTLLGLIGMWVLRTFELITLPEDVYGSAKLPIDLPLSDFGLIILGASVIIMLSALYPAKKAASTDPLSVLRNE